MDVVSMLKSKDAFIPCNLSLRKRFSFTATEKEAASPFWVGRVHAELTYANAGCLCNWPLLMTVSTIRGGCSVTSFPFRWLPALEIGVLFLASRAGSMPMLILTSFVLVWPLWLSVWSRDVCLCWHVLAGMVFVWIVSFGMSPVELYGLKNRRAQACHNYNICTYIRR